MKRKYFTQVLAAAVTAAMLMSTACAVFAAEAAAPVSHVYQDENGVHYSSSTIDDSQKGSITLYKYEENNGNMKEGTGLKDDTVGADRRPISGVQFKAKKIADIKNISGKIGEERVMQQLEQAARARVAAADDAPAALAPSRNSGDERDVTGVYYVNLDEGFLNLLAQYHITVEPYEIRTDDGEIDAYTAQDMMDALSELNSKQADDANDTNKSGETAVEDYVDQNATKEFAYTDAQGKASIDSLDLGLYLIAETDIKPDAILEDEDKRGQENVEGDTSQNHQDIETRTAPYLVSVPMTNVTDMKSSDGTTVKTGTAWMYDITSYPKNQTTTITKKIVDPDTKDDGKLEDYEDYSIGDIVKQVIYADAPANLHLSGTEDGRADLAARDYVIYAISDKMETGLKFDGVTKVLVGDKLSDPEKGTDFDSMQNKEELVEGTDYKVVKAPVTVNADEDLDTKLASADAPDGDLTEFAVQLTKAGIEKLNKRTSEGQVVVYFDSEITPDAKVGTVDKNTNQATLTWQHNPGNVYTKKSNETRVFTYEIDATKTAQDAKASFDPSETKFIVQQAKRDGDGWATKDSTDQTSKNVLIDETDISTGKDKYADLVRFVKEEDGVYHVYADGIDKEEDAVTEVSPAKDGKMNLKGLDAAKYTFTEIQTKDHYSLLKESFDVDLTASTQTDSGTYRKSDALQRQAENGKLDSHVNGRLQSAIVSTDGTETDLDLDDMNRGIAKMNIVNDTVIVLRTGGRGTMRFYVVSITAGAAAVGAVLYGLKKKKGAK